MFAPQRRLVLPLLGACTVGCLLATGAVLAEALQLPDVKAPSQVRMLQAAEAQYQRYAASPDAFFAIDAAKSVDWPCEVPASLTQALTGTSDYAAGAGGTGYGHSYSNIVLHPVAASCQNGQLDGRVELVYEATRKAWGPTHEDTSQETGRVVATVTNGKVVHREELRKSVDGATGKPGGVASSVEDPDGAFLSSATILVTGDSQKYFLKQPVRTSRGMRLEKRFYNGATLVSVDHADAKGKNDGLSVSYAGGSAKKSCYKQGKPTDLKACGS